MKKRPDACLLSAARRLLLPSGRGAARRLLPPFGRGAEISQTRWRSDMRNFGRFAFSRRLVCCFSLVRGAPFPTHRERSEDARSGRQGLLPDGFGPGQGFQAQQDQNMPRKTRIRNRLVPSTPNGHEALPQTVAESARGPALEIDVKQSRIRGRHLARVCPMRHRYIRWAQNLGIKLVHEPGSDDRPATVGRVKRALPHAPFRF